MDSPEAIANKSYESFAEHYVNEGIKKERCCEYGPRLQDGGFLALNRSFREKRRNSHCN